MPTDWNCLTESAQLAMCNAAMAKAAEAIAQQAETLAEEIEVGALDDRGGPEALRLLAAVVRALNSDAGAPAGHA